jgi:hypothetical protein
MTRLLLLAFFFFGAAHAQPYPAKPVKIIVRTT